MRKLLLSLPLCLMPLAALANPDAILAEAAKTCAAKDNGTLTSEGALRQIDLTGDGTPETVVDEALFVCSTAPDLFVAPEGTRIHLFAGDTETTLTVQGYETARWADALIILLALDGASCGAAPETPCFEALTWAGDRFVSVRAPG
jgi:hypothetical protein